MSDKLCISLAITIFVCCLKLLLIPSYHSTDYEVHRNWMALTYSLPIKEWYFENTSEWTLDYPPFFAYFEWLLSHWAALVDPNMLVVENLDYNSDNTLMFMRISVIVTDLVLLYATWVYLTSMEQTLQKHTQVFALVAFNAGLLLVDHIHFQYNGVLMGVLVLCLYAASSQQYLLLASAFSVLVLMKHLFAPLAPIIAVFLIQRHCFSVTAARRTWQCSLVRFLQLAGIAVIALAAAFGPFVLQTNGVDQLAQIISRLFPFGRGLVHAYWAPNIWALYCASDKLLYIIITKLNIPSLAALLRTADTGVASSTAGLVGDFAFAVLPPVSAAACLGLVGTTLLPAVLAVWSKPTHRTLLAALVYASMCSFMLGYHVHEKAVIIPMLLQTFLLLEPDAVLETYDTCASIVSPTPNTVDAKPPKATDGSTDVGTPSVGDAAPASGVAAGLRSRKGRRSSKALPKTEAATDAIIYTDDSVAECVGTTVVGGAQAQRLPSLARDRTGGRLERFLHRVVFGLLVLAGLYGLFPLFFTLREVFTKSAIYVCYVSGVWTVLVPSSEANSRLQTHLKVQLSLCLISICAVFVFSEILHPVYSVDSASGEGLLPFLPRMLTSVVCALYLTGAWLLSAAALFIHVRK